MPDQREITIRLHCTNLPGDCHGTARGLRLGIQRGKEVIEDVPGGTEAVTFTAPVRVATNPKNGRPNFLGSFAQGTPEERFIYLSWGVRSGEAWEIVRRAKIHLKHLDWPHLEPALTTGAPIEADLHMTDACGGPLCASVKPPFIRWRV